MARRYFAVLSSLAMAFILSAYAADEKPKDKDAKKPDDTSAIKDELTLKKEIDARKFRDFQQSLLRLAQRLEASNKPEDRERAANIRKAIELASASGVDTRFDRLIVILKSSKALSYQEVKDAMEQNKMLVADIRAILTLLLSDNRDDALKAEKNRLTELLKQIDKAVRDEKLNRARVEGGRVDKKDLADAENKNRKQVEAIAKAMGKDGGKSEPKGDPKADDKKDGKGDNKPEGANKDKDAKGDDKKDGKGNESKGDPKDKPDAKGDPKGEAKKPEAKGDPKAEGKPSDKPGDKADAKDSKGKPNDKGDSKADGKKPDSPPKGDSKSDSKQAKDDKNDGKPKDQGQKSQAQGESKDGGKQDQAKQPPQPPQPPQKQGDQPEATPGKKQIEDAEKYQKAAEEQINKEERDKASEQQSKAIEELERARKKLEEILKQLREEEIERLLAALQARCERMLQMQIEVHNGTVEVDKAFGPNPKKDDEPQRANVQKAIDLSKREFQIVEEANKAIALLEAEGSAVAFPEVFHQVRDDMRHVERRLGKSDVHNVTQVIEQDIISTLKDMVEALKKAQQEQQAKKNPPPGQAPPPGQQDQKLIDLLAELKMIRAMQLRVNSRTKTYGDQYTGEQAQVNEIQKELQDLANRQQKIFEVTNNISKGKNK